MSCSHARTRFFSLTASISVKHTGLEFCVYKNALLKYKDNEEDIVQLLRGH